MNHLNDLPSVEQVLQRREAADFAKHFGRPLTLEAIRTALYETREFLKSNPAFASPPISTLLQRAGELLADWNKPVLQQVINATGVILHTNLGRAPLSRATMEAMQEIGQGYSNLEMDLATGKRGERFLSIESILQRLTGTEAALVVNNNAGAVLLVLTALARKKHVIVARSQLVEIGGGFRMPDVMKQSGAKIYEVGTTNMVHLTDYTHEFSHSEFLVRVHRSNFKIIGYTEEPEFKTLVEAAHHTGVIVIDDLGSGALQDTARYGLAHEPMVQESLKAGADVVCFSGDKLIGGPQAGIVIGKASLIAKAGGHPLARALRADKICLAGLAATLSHYLRDEADRDIPVWKMISMASEDIRMRAVRWMEELGIGEVQSSDSTLGGGSLPGESLPTFVLSLGVRNAADFLKKLREQIPPIIARAEKNRVLLDPRTVQSEDDPTLLRSLKVLLTEAK